MESQPAPRSSPEEAAKTATCPPGSASFRAVEGDFYQIAQLVNATDQGLLSRVRAFAEERVAPVINQYWGRAEFPFEFIKEYGTLGIAGAPYRGFGCLGKSALLDGLIMMELARIDCSIATFHGVHSGLAMGSIYLCGSDEQRQRWLPAMQRAEKIGAFGLTEPEVGSGAALWDARRAPTNTHYVMPVNAINSTGRSPGFNSCRICLCGCFRM